MLQTVSHNFDRKYLVTMSFIGLFLAGMLTIYPPTAQENVVWRKLLIGSIFGLICTFGILAVFLPNPCSRVFDSGKKRIHDFPHGEFVSHGASPTLRGHHPDCGNFAAHMFRIGDKTLCAACTGLLSGGVSALLGTLFYFFTNYHIEQDSSFLVWVGVLGVGLGLFQFECRSFIRLFLNLIFVLGAFFVLVGIDRLVQSVTVDLFLVGLTLFWLFTRISLSRWDRERICCACGVANCEFKNRKRG